MKCLILCGGRLGDEFPSKALAPLTHIQHLELDYVNLIQHHSLEATPSPPCLQPLTITDYDKFGSDGKLGCLTMKPEDGKFVLDLSGLKKVQFGLFYGTSLKAACDVFRSHNIIGLESLLIGISHLMNG